MHGISNIAADRTVRLTIAGRQYTATVRILGEYAAQERYLLDLRPNPLEVIEKLPPLPPAPVCPPPIPPSSPLELHQRHGQELAAHQLKKHAWDELRDRRAAMEKKAWDLALAPAVISLEEMSRFELSLHGIGYRLWRALRMHHPEIDSVQAALDLLDEHGTNNLSSVLDALDQSEEKDILGNSGPPTTGGDMAAAGSPGPTSTPSSLLGTDGLPG